MNYSQRFPYICRSVLIGIMLINPVSAIADGWTIENKSTGFMFNTATGIAIHREVDAKGLVTVKKVAGKTLKIFWEQGAASQTLELDNKTLSGGYFEANASRKQSVRLSRSGSVVYLESAKGPKSKVWLVQDRQKIRSWKRGTKLSIVQYDHNGVLIAERVTATQSIQFYYLGLDRSGKIDPGKRIEIGAVKGCSYISAAARKMNFSAELICANSTGRGVYQIDPTSGLIKISDDASDEVSANSLLRRIAKTKQHGKTGVLTVEGSPDALHFYHAINGLFLRELGEPVSQASDESGKQSWGQSYRTTALAQLHEKSGHPVFAQIANQAMRNTLNNQNGKLGIRGDHNPDCGWASRIYSEDKTTPISFLINQSIITSALIRSCEALGETCEPALRTQINQTSICIANSFEKQFDDRTGLYRIKKGIPFRFDGIWAPWNWQLSFARVLRHAGKVSNTPKWEMRAEALKSKFLTSVDYRSDGALWRYWPPSYYDGWRVSDEISVNKPKFRPKENERYEDINHAGISLLGLCEFDLPTKFLKQARKRLETLIKDGGELPRDVDGRGPVSSRWQPAAGWDCLKSELLKRRLTRKLPTAGFGPTLLSYARLYDPSGDFELKLVLKACDRNGCDVVRDWKYQSASGYMQASPFFSLSENKRGS